MKNAVIFHGSSSTPKSFWYPWLKKELERLGYSVWVPQLPQPEAPNLKIQLPFVVERVRSLGRLSADSFCFGTY